MVVGSAHTRVLVRDWGRAEAPIGEATIAFEAVTRKAAKKRPSIFRSRFNTTLLGARVRRNIPPREHVHGYRYQPRRLQTLGTEGFVQQR